MNEKKSLRILLKQNNFVKLMVEGFNQDKIPIISNIEIDSFADRLLRKHNKSIFKLSSNVQPINIDSLIEKTCNKNLYFYQLSSNKEIFGVTARLGGSTKIFNYANGQIILKSGDICVDDIACNSEHRIRFTLAHELGHSLFHIGVTLNSGKSNFTDDIHTITNHKSKTSEDWMEHHANVFAESILMPKKLIFRLQKKFLRKCEGIDKMMLRSLFNDEVAEIFNVSTKAAEIRIKRLRIMYPNKIII